LVEKNANCHLVEKVIGQKGKIALLKFWIKSNTNKRRKNPDKIVFSIFRPTDPSTSWPYPMAMKSTKHSSTNRKPHEWAESREELKNRNELKKGAKGQNV
jgi:hypothetical protein